MKLEKSDKPLCVACGLCCDGTLHGQTNVETNSKKAGKYKNSNINLSHTITTTFKQPCVEYNNKLGCKIYTQRPKTCSNYKCLLLRKVGNKKINKDKALKVIKVAQNSRDTLLQHFSTQVCFIRSENLMGKFMVLHAKDINTPLRKKTFTKTHPEIFKAYFTFDHALDSFIRKRGKYKL